VKLSGDGSTQINRLFARMLQGMGTLLLRIKEGLLRRFRAEQGRRILSVTALSHLPESRDSCAHTLRVAVARLVARFFSLRRMSSPASFIPQPSSILRLRSISPHTLGSLLHVGLARACCWASSRFGLIVRNHIGAHSRSVKRSGFFQIVIIYARSQIWPIVV